MAADKADGDAKMLTAQARMVEAQARAHEGLAAGQPNGPEPPPPIDPIAAQDAKTRQFDAQTKRQALGIKLHEAQLEDANRDQDREAQLHEAYLALAKEVLHAPLEAEKGAAEIKLIEKQVNEATPKPKDD